MSEQLYDHEKWVKDLKVGDMVCDCRYKHCKITSFTVSGSGDKNLQVDGGYAGSGISCSARHCCGPVDHEHWYVYILKCSDDTLYTGITNNLERRIGQHNKGKSGAKYTRTRRPVKLFKTIMVSTKSQALKLEYKIKQLSRSKKMKLKAYEHFDSETLKDLKL